MGRSRLNTAHALRFAHRQHVGATAPHRGSPLHPQFLPRKDIKIAHVVARHSSESIIYKKWFPFPLMVHFLRRMEIEADHIGMLLMAAAGFDPHIAPMVLEKQGNDIYHPSGKKRAQLLSRAKVMDEVLELYREVMPAKAPEV